MSPDAKGRYRPIAALAKGMLREARDYQILCRVAPERLQYGMSCGPCSTTLTVRRGGRGVTYTPTERDAESACARLRRRKVVQRGLAYVAAASGFLRCGGYIAAAFLVVSGKFTAASDTPTCVESQRARVDVQTPWRCMALLEAGRSYLVRVDRQSIDVTLELLAPDAKHTLKVDSPTRRASPELLFYRASVRGKHTLIVSTLEHGVPTAPVEVKLREVSPAVSEHHSVEG